MLAALLPTLLPFVNDWLKRAFPDPAEREKQMQSLLAQLQAADSAQLEVNKVEAAHPNIFVSGWRPAVGWLCAAGLGWAFVGAPIAAWILILVSPGTPLPTIQSENLLELVLAMLGLGGLRSFEKIRNAARK